MLYYFLTISFWWLGSLESPRSFRRCCIISSLFHFDDWGNRGQCWHQSGIFPLWCQHRAPRKPDFCWHQPRISSIWCSISIPHHPFSVGINSIFAILIQHWPSRQECGIGTKYTFFRFDTALPFQAGMRHRHQFHFLPIWYSIAPDRA